jgi:glutaredoxin
MICRISRLGVPALNFLPVILPAPGPSACPASSAQPSPSPFPTAEVDYGSRDVLSDPELRDGIKKFTHWPTIPQVFIGGEFVGGSDILMQMHRSGELKTTLESVASKQ